MSATAFLMGALAAALLLSLAANAAQFFVSKRSIRVALTHETRALDRAHAAELRSAQQIDAMLERISTTPRLEVRPATPEVKVDPEAKRYISDFPYQDRDWNDFVGDQAEDESEQ